MDITIPGYGHFTIHNILLDYNGTIASDGKILPILDALEDLTAHFNVYILTGNTFGDAQSQFHSDKIKMIMSKDAIEKRDFMLSQDPKTCIAVGNGAIDHLMLKAAAIGIAVLGDEGCATKAIMNADIMVKSIEDAISLIINPQKLVAGLKE